MSYIVKRDLNNGYRCGCCKYSWDDVEVVDTLEEALAFVPVENDGKGDSVLDEVEVTDGADGEMIAWGRMSRPYLGRSYDYQATRWTGYRPDTGSFESCTKEEWEDTLNGLKRKKYEYEISKATTELEKAQKTISYNRKLLDELPPPQPAPADSEGGTVMS